MSQSIVLATLNAKYIHAAFGLRYLAANMGELESRTLLREFTIHERPSDIVEAIVSLDPVIVGLGVYIWNAEPMAKVVGLLRRVMPGLVIVVGGPEVSHEIEDQGWLAEVDYVVRGEGDTAFATLCRRVLNGQRPLQKVVDGGQPDLEVLRLPYALYDSHDLDTRVTYVEASRGCPYRCEFCLSSLDKKVRAFPLEPLLDAFDGLLERGVRQFKFVDRTFNLDVRRSASILEFFLARLRPGLFLHFEMVPDRLPDSLRETIAAFPPGTLQFEVGIQSLDEDVGRRIQRRQDLDKTFANLEFLRTSTGVHLHTDLIIGLPGEGAESFGAGLDRLVASGVQEVQIGVLKRLRGTPIARHAEEFEMVFDPRPPYEILSTRDIDFATMQRLKRFALVWDTYVNRGNFRQSVGSLWGGGSPFTSTLAFSNWLFGEAGKVHSISLKRRAGFLLRHLVHAGHEESTAGEMILDDLERAGHPIAMLGDLGVATSGTRSGRTKPVAARQQRHL